MNPLELQIAPDIINDGLFSLLKEYAKKPDVKTILEIGTGSGDGSTTAFIEGMKMNPNADKRFMTIDVSIQRSKRAHEKFAKNDFAVFYYGCAVDLSGYESDERIVEFYNASETALNRHPCAEILKWKQNELNYISENNVPLNVVESIRKIHQIEHFDFVLIDGSEFTGVAELAAVIGAKYIALDDINCLKNLDNYNALKQPGSGYELQKVDWNLRNGYAIFKKVTNGTN